MAMHNAVLLARPKRVAENQRQQRKKVQKRLYIAKRGVLSGAEGLGLIEKRDSSQNNSPADVQQEVRQRAPSKCSLCSSLEHNARKCPERQSTV